MMNGGILGTRFREGLETVATGVAKNVTFDKNIATVAMSVLIFILTGTAANNGFAGTAINKYVFKIGTRAWLDVQPVELQTLFEYMLSRNGGQVPASNDLTWPVPLELFAMLFPGLDGVPVPSFGIPEGPERSFILEGDTDWAVGDVEFAYHEAERAITHLPILVGFPMSTLIASTPDQRYDLNTLEQLPCAGFIIPFGATEFTRIRFHLADEKGVPYEECDVKRDHVLAGLQPYHLNSIATHLFIPFGKPRVIGPKSYIKFNTGAAVNGTQRLVPVFAQRL